MKPSKQNTLFTLSYIEKAKARRGFLLLAVLIVISAVTLAATAFMKSMLLGHEESRITGQSIQARYAADSGIDAARLFVAYSRAARLEAGGTFNNPNTFQAIPVLQSPDPANPCNYTIIASNLNEDGKYSGIRFGLQNESARLNLNVLPTIDTALSLPAALLGASTDSIMPTLSGSSSITSAAGSNNSGTAGSQTGSSASVGRDLLMSLPGMDEYTADAILDFIDPDDEPREFGAEREYYTQLPSPYAPVNGPLNSIEQLLLVRGVTPYMLFGLDQNRNGVLESSESNAAMMSGGMPGATGPMGMNAGMSGTTGSSGSAQGQQASPPDLGWAMYLTLYSKERNLTADGSPRVNLNTQDMTNLRTDLAAVVGDDLATFVIAYRNFGPSSGSGGLGALGGMGGMTGGMQGGGMQGGGGMGGGNGRGGNNGPGGSRGGNNGPGGGPGGGGQGGGGPGGQGGPGGGRGGFGPGGGGGGPGGGGGAPGGRGGRSDFSMLEFANPVFSLVAIPVSYNQPPAGGRGGAGAGGGGGRGGQGGGGPGGGGFGGQGPGAGGGRGGQGPGGGGPGGGFGGGRGGNNGPGMGQGGGRGGNNGPGGNNGAGGGRGGNNGPGGGGGFGGPGGGGGGGLGQGGGSGGQPAETRPWSASNFEALGIDATQPGQFQVNGVLELIDASFEANVNGQQIRFTSPLTSSPVQMALYLPMLMDKVTTVEAPMLPGRININEAPKEILAGLPGITDEILEKLIESRASQSDTENRKYETWPMVEGILTLDQMKSIAPLVTGGGDVMRVQSVGYFEQTAGFSRTEAVIDGAGPVPVIVLYRKLDHLGRGFAQSTLGQRAMGNAIVSTP